MNSKTVPEDLALSIVLGRVSTENGDRVLETISALDPEYGGAPCEIVISDRLQDAVSERKRKEHPHVRLIPCPPEMTLPEMCLLAFDETSGSVVAVTEDHCVPSRGWAKQVLDAFAEGGDEVLAVGGNVVNGVCDHGLDWATSICEKMALRRRLRPAGTNGRAIRFHIEAYGDRGMAKAYYAPMFATVIRLNRPGGQKSVERRFYPESIIREKFRGWQSTVIQAFVEEFDDFAGAAAGQSGSGRIALAAGGLRAVQTAHAVYHSSRTGNRVTLPPLQ